MDEHDFSYIFSTEEILKENYSTIKKFGKIKIDMKIKNNGVNDIPRKTEIISLKDDDESQFFISETLIHNGNAIKVGETIDLIIYLFPKKNIKFGKNNLNFKLRNKYFGIIGKENNLNIYVIDDRTN